jgi:uncharacterized membrane protein YjjP (DUF1212 family)
MFKGPWQDHRQAYFPAFVPFALLMMVTALAGHLVAQMVVDGLWAWAVAFVTGTLVGHARIALWRHRHPVLTPLEYAEVKWRTAHLN